MKKNNVSYNAWTYMHVLKGLCKEDELEHALDFLETMKNKRIEVSLMSYVQLVACCLRLNDSQTAMYLLKEAEATHQNLESQPLLIMDAMRVAAYTDDVS